MALIVVLLIARPRGGLLGEAVRLLPDVLRLIRRLAADKTLPRGVRVRLGLLLAYLASRSTSSRTSFPVLGYADDAIIVTAVRSVVRRAGLDAVRAHWSGTDDGFAATSADAFTLAVLPAIAGLSAPTVSSSSRRARLRGLP